MIHSLYQFHKQVFYCIYLRYRKRDPRRYTSQPGFFETANVLVGMTFLSMLNLFSISAVLDIFFGFDFAFTYLGSNLLSTTVSAAAVYGANYFLVSRVGAQNIIEEFESGHSILNKKLVNFYLVASVILCVSLVILDKNLKDGLSFPDFR